MVKSWRWVWTSLVTVAACVGDSSNVPDGGGDATTDATPDVASDAPPDVALDAGDAGPMYATTIADPTRWESYDFTAFAPMPGYSGGAFDGRYVYFVPGTSATCTPTCNSVIIRYDTKGSFQSAWEAFDVSPIGGGGFAGAVYAAPYLYFVPYRNPGYTPANFVRYDTTKPFKTGNSYASIDVSTVDSKDKAFGSGAFDGTYVYMVSQFGGNAARYDTTGAFTDAGSYQQSFISTNYLYGYAVYDGKSVYYSPYEVIAPTGPLGLFMKYDTNTSFNTFVTFDMRADGGVDDQAGGFGGILYDGRYVYLEPYGISPMPGLASLVVRFDPSMSITNPAAYTKLDLSTVDSNAHGFVGCTFDGRYMYFAPNKTSTTVRFDTTHALTDTSAWQAYDLSKGLDASSAHGYEGAVFDGQYVYYVPEQTTLVVRFNAKTPPSLPPFQSSFF